MAKQMRPVTYENYKGLLKKLAFPFTQRLLNARVIGVNADDVEGELNYAFVKAVQGYKPDSGCVFSTYLHTVARNHFNHWAEKLIKEQYGVESLPDTEQRDTTRGLGYCAIEVVSNDAGDPLSLYDVTEDDTYASPEQALHAKQVVNQLIADATLSSHTRIYLMSVINPGMDIAPKVQKALRDNAATIRREIFERYGVNAKPLRIGAVTEA